MSWHLTPTVNITDWVCEIHEIALPLSLDELQEITSKVNRFCFFLICVDEYIKKNESVMEILPIAVVIIRDIPNDIIRGHRCVIEIQSGCRGILF